MELLSCERERDKIIECILIKLHTGLIMTRGQSLLILRVRDQS